MHPVLQLAVHMALGILFAAILLVAHLYLTQVALPRLFGKHRAEIRMLTECFNREQTRLWLQEISPRRKGDSVSSKKDASLGEGKPQEESVRENLAETPTLEETRRSDTARVPRSSQTNP